MTENRFLIPKLLQFEIPCLLLSNVIRHYWIDGNDYSQHYQTCPATCFFKQSWTYGYFKYRGYNLADFLDQFTIDRIRL